MRGLVRTPGSFGSYGGYGGEYGTGAMVSSAAGGSMVGGPVAGGSWFRGGRFGFGGPGGFWSRGPGYGYVAPGHGPGYAGGGCADDCDAVCGPAACGPACAGCATCGGACGGVGCGGGTAGYTYAVVGEGGGDYAAVTNYRYVGAGAGNVALVPIPGPGCSCWWSLCLFLPLLLIPLFFLPHTTTTTTTTTTVTTPTFTFPPTTPGADIPPATPAPPPPPTPAPQGPSRICRIYGDPHVTTFDGSHASFYSSGEYWVVKSATVWMQGRYLPTPVTNGLSVTKEIAIGGPFLESKDGSKNTLRISALGAMWNGQPIIPGFPDSWSNKDPEVKVVTDGNGEVMQTNRAGKQMHVVHVELPLGVRLQINRWNEPGEGDYINTQITMSKQPDQDGHCGNFNGNPADDTRPQIRARIGTTGVSANVLLFNTKTPVSAPNRPDLNDCPTDKAERARQLCAGKSQNGMANKDCMIDVCFGGDQFAALTDYD